MTRFQYVATVVELLLHEERTGDVSMDGLTWSMKAAATGDKDRFERMVERFVPEELRHDVRALAHQTVFAELGYREKLIENPKAKKIPPFETWHSEIKLMLDLLLGPRNGDGPRVRLEPPPLRPRSSTGRAPIP